MALLMPTIWKFLRLHQLETKYTSFKFCNMEKYWSLELTGAELALVQLAVVDYVTKYQGRVFSEQDLKNIIDIVYFPKHRAL